MIGKYMGKHRNSEHHIDGYSLFALFIMLLFFFFILYCTSHTSLIADDYAYMFDFSTGWDEPNTAGIYPPPEGCERINSVTQIIPSMSAHRSCMNGRVFSHGLVQLFLMLPKTLFNVIDALIFTLEMGLIALLPTWVLGQMRKKNAPLFLGVVFSCICFFQMNFGEVNLWLDGAINYLWGSVLGLLYIGSYLMLYYNEWFFSCRGRKLEFLILSFIVGAYNESLGCTLSAFSFLVILYLRKTKKKIDISAVLSFFLTVLGFIFLVSAPATMVNKIQGGSFLFAVRNAIKMIPVLVKSSRRILGLLILVILLLTYALKKQINRDHLSVSLIILLCAIVCFFSLSLAGRVPLRAFFFIPVLLCLDCMWLLTCIFEGEEDRAWCKAGRVAIAVIASLFIISCVPKGVADIYKVSMLTSSNEKQIIAARESGESVAFIHDIPREGLSSFVALEGLNYIDRDNPESWPNVYMAKYYGLDEIRAVR